MIQDNVYSTVEEMLRNFKKSLGIDVVALAKNVAPPLSPKEIRWAAIVGNESEAYRNIQLRIGHGIAGLVWRTGRPLHEEAIQSKPKLLLDYPIARMENLNTVWAYPVVEHQEIKAVLLFGNRQNTAISDQQTLNNWASLSLNESEKRLLLEG